MVVSTLSYDFECGILTMDEQEVDVPGHTAAIGRTHPELVACLDHTWPGYALGMLAATAVI